LREAKGAVRGAARGRVDLEVLAAVALGRVLLHGRRQGAREAFEGLLECASARPGLLRVARLGRALASAASREDEDLRAAVMALESWGDRRILSFALSDVDRLLGPSPAPAAEPAPPPEAGPSLCAHANALVAAAVAAAADGDWPARFAEVMRAARAVLPWW